MSKVPQIRVEPPGRKAREIIKIDEKYLATSTKTSPIAVESASGSVVTDVDGNVYLDFASGVGVLNIGHCHPKVVKAVRDQAEKVMHFAGTDFYYDVQSRLVKKLSEICPGKYDKRVFLSNSGTEAIEAAMKVARWHTQRKQFISFIGAFHGRTMGSLSLTASKPVQRNRYFPLVPGGVHIPFAYCYRCPYHLEYPSCGIWCGKILEEIYFDSFLPPEEVAALFMEPVQGEGGYVVPPVEFVKIISKTCKSHGMLLVDDEVQAGMGRTGKLWGIEHFDIVPDILCAAKALGSGVPIGATIYHRKLDFGVQGAHSNTFGGNLLACASALATIDVIENENVLEMATKAGRHLRKRLEELMDKHEIIGDVRGLGMMQATELVEDRKTKEPAKKKRDKVVELCYKRGVILLPCGKSSIRYIPPLTTSLSQIDAGIAVIDSAVRDAMK
ncbi:MAG: acetyl ornithine aminotransferase family protein [Methanomassiliicoccales archaeon]|nr:acetyl ornithine aminotransferase family protein [Methanomassiliicoccales archaeon]